MQPKAVTQHSAPSAKAVMDMINIVAPSGGKGARLVTGHFNPHGNSMRTITLDSSQGNQAIKVKW